MMESLRQKVSCFILIVCLSSIVCANVTYNFDCITNNSAYNAACGESKLSVSFEDIGNSKTVVTFSNSGVGDSGVIEEVFFEDASGLLSFSNFNPFNPGVEFNFKNKKLNLQGGNEPEVGFRESYGFYATKPAPKNGVGLEESLSIVFDYSSSDFQALIDSIENNELRIGIHVISFSYDGNSESFINTTAPVPGSFLIASFGSVVLGWIKKRKLL